MVFSQKPHFFLVRIVRFLELSNRQREQFILPLVTMSLMENSSMDKASSLCEQGIMVLSQETVVSVLLAQRTSLLGYIWSMVRDPHVAEDVFQEVSVLLLEKREELNDVKALPTWLRRAARFRALARLRNQERTPTMLSASTMDLIDACWEKEEEPNSGDIIAALHHCLAKLTPTARRMLLLRYDDGLSGAEVAEVVGLKTGAVYTALSRVHTTLRGCISGHLGKGASCG